MIRLNTVTPLYLLFDFRISESLYRIENSFIPVSQLFEWNRLNVVGDAIWQWETCFKLKVNVLKRTVYIASENEEASERRNRL